jgi:uncharacterized membrane protein YphA (DoxX/SURF4 family)
MRNLLAERKAHVVTFNGAPSSPVYVREPAFQAFAILRVTFAALSIAAGAEKFFHALAYWDQFLSPRVFTLIGGRVRGFMDLVGLVEISAGVLVAIKPRWGAPIVGLGLLAIAVNLLAIHGYSEFVLRQFGLAAGALALFRLSMQFDD